MKDYKNDSNMAGKRDPPVCFDKYLHWFFSIHSKLPHTIKNHEADYPPPTYWTLDIWSISSCISTLPIQQTAYRLL